MGRLIDADAFAEFVKEYVLPQSPDGFVTKLSILTALNHKSITPTIDNDNNVPNNGWISVKDRLPETRHAVLAYTPYHKNIWAVSMHEDGNWYIWSPHGRVYLDPDWHGPITHWMPLPEPPKEES